MAKSRVSTDWTLREAKARLGDLVNRARRTPQRIKVQGKPAVIVISAEAYAALTRSKKRTLVDHILEGSVWADDLVEAINARSPDRSRKLPSD